MEAPTVSLTVSQVDDKQKDQEIITIQMDKELEVGKNYKVVIEFISTLNTDLRGFYRSSYDENGEIKLE